ncbi:MAG: NAD-binding protein [Thermoplasmata archaeon]
MRGRIGYSTLLFRRLWKFLVAYVAVLVVAAVGFFALDGGHEGVLNSFYWAIVTLSTIGYGDVVPTTVSAKLFTIGIAGTEVFLGAYLVTLVIGVVSEESQHRVLGTLGTAMTGHIVVLGYSPVGQSAVRELLEQEQRIAVVTERVDEVANVRTLAREDRLYVTYGPPADREILARANVPSAHAVIVCTADDATNMIAALNVRAIAPGVRVVVSVARPELRETLRFAGVTYVASPADMGGRLCASAAFEPDVATALEDLSEGSARSDIQEYLLSPTTPISSQSFGAAEILVRRATGCILIGYARAEEGDRFTLHVDPEPERPLHPGDALLILGTIANVRRFRDWFGADQGR